jgi:uncharacterized protein
MMSSIYQGSVTHHRLVPKPHKFTYKICMVYLDLDELGNIFDKIACWSDNGKKSLAYFKRSDYLRPHDLPLKDAVRAEIMSQRGMQHTGPVRMLTNLRAFGVCFNPVTFYYCFDESDTALQFVVTEVTNTPWLERHRYVVDLRQEKAELYPKQLHVSPFMGMDMQYEFNFKVPADFLTAAIHILKQECLMRVHMCLKRQPITPPAMRKLLWRLGFINYKVVLGIYWQALKLFFKKVPIHDHPGGKNAK